MYPPTPSSVTRSLAALVFMLLLGCSSGRIVAAETVVISEFMASNTSGAVDEDGETSDWIEILNAGSSNISLSGWRLTDDPSNLSKWVFPATNLPPNGFLLVWASSKDRRSPGKPLHANFGLNANGEYLALIKDIELVDESQYRAVCASRFVLCSEACAGQMAEKMKNQ